MESDYIIDFQRVNELTSTKYDTEPNENAPFGKYVHHVSRKVIKDYLDIYNNRDLRKSDNKKVLEAIETLHYNGILISKSDIRDGKIKEILDEN